MNKKVEIEVSARHIHLSKKDFDFIFGNMQFRNIKELSQRGEYATDKIVRLVGPKGEVSARFLSPFRDETQAEISLTDCIKIGVKPLFESDIHEGGSKAKIIGDAGEVDRKCIIVAKRHLHANTKDAKELNLHDRERVSVIIETKRGRINFEEVVVKIADSYQLRVHLDTDEGNAAGIIGTEFGELAN
jgi:putative phosphotransacetylase